MQSLYLLHCSIIVTLFRFITAVISASDSHFFTHSIYPNFTATSQQLIDSSGTFLHSQNGTFATTILYRSLTRVDFCIVHIATNTRIWSANRGNLISYSAELRLTAGGLKLSDDHGRLVWSTPALTSPVSALRLLDTGNLVLVDRKNVSLWQSFDYPTDTIVAGQRLRVGASLVGDVEDNHSSRGNYRLSLSDQDLTLDWFGQAYWKLSLDTNSYKNSNKPISYGEVNGSGLFLWYEKGNSSEIVMRFFYETASGFSLARMASNGFFEIGGFEVQKKMTRPVESFRVPEICGKLGLLSWIESRPICSCTEGFQVESSGCLPRNKSLSLSTPCTVTTTGNRTMETDPKFVKYLHFSNAADLDYFSIKYTLPTERSVNLSVCQNLCSQSCSCQGLAYQNHSGTGNCYLIHNNIGSVFTSAGLGFSMYVKAFHNVSSAANKKKPEFPVLGLVLVLVLLGLGALLIISGLLLLWFRKKRNSERSVPSLGRRDSSSWSSCFIAGLPLRFEYNELVEATGDFGTEIGSGGFGTVYKGTLQDETKVAVKKIANSGERGKQEFLTELAVIGRARHANLVRLLGFCIQGSDRFLVLEFMNRGSLEKILFGGGPVLEWRDRFEVALGTARALAYLHCGCERKVIHCDVKPENILLRDGSQAKVSDFGLSKLVDQETSKVVTALRGTRGYLAPEWLSSLGVTEKFDVYSFGMVLFEIVSGKRNLSLRTKNGQEESGLCLSSPSLTRYGYFPCLALEMHKQRRYSELLDPRLEGRANGDEVETIVRVALCCVHAVPVLRPTMDNVVAMLEGRLASGEPSVEALAFLEPFGERVG